MISWVRSLTLSKWRTASKLPAAPLAEPWMSTSIWLVPSTAAKTSASAPVIQPWAPGYSGWLGVVSSGAHQVAHCQQPHRVHQVKAVLDGELTEGLVVLVDDVGVPEQPDRGLRWCSHGAVGGAVGLHLVEPLSPLRAGQGRRRTGAKLRRRLQHERLHEGHPRRLCEL